jgi:5-hydroxyisourate hydrolase-like protein (transthyretin family)
LRENTTYSIFLNKTIKDITESNDSIMQLVFSTGPFIDSLSYTTFVLDSKDGQPKKNVVVGLFEHPDSLKPIYFAQTNQDGKAHLKYLREGNYYLRAFEDGSKQGNIGKNDAVAFKELAVKPDVDFVDSVPLRMFSPLPKPDVTTFTYNAPGTFTVGANRSLKNAEIRLNGDIISQNQIKFFEKDSLLIIARPGEENPVVLSVTTEEWTDTVRTRIPPIRTKTQRISSLKSDYFPGQPIVLTIPDFIDAIDTSKIIVFNLSDSTEIKNYSAESKQANELHLTIPNFEGERIKISLKSGAITATEEWKIPDFEQTYTKRSDKEFGILNVKISGYSVPIVVEMLFKNAVVNKELVTESKTLRFEKLEPGEYTFRIIVDNNGNGQWDTGNFEEKIQPEEIHLFSTPTKVRANWEIDMELVPLDAEEEVDSNSGQ